MSTTTQAKSTATSARGTANKAAGTARSAKNDVTTSANKATRTARRETKGAARGVTHHSKRVAAAAQTEAAAVARQPLRPLLFAVGVVDRTTAGVRALPGTVLQTPGLVRQRIVGAAATAGDVAERVQRGYSEVAEDGAELVKSIRGQESTQRAVRLAERAQSRGARAFQDTEKAIEVVAEAAQEAVAKIGD